jgi:Raf kinase inhibitor-like YbhB/YbcL family protein
MKKFFVTSFLFVLTSMSVQAESFKLSSSEISEGKNLTSKQVFNGFGCSGENIAPSLSWGEAPEGTKSLAITVYDPDAPTGSGWWHWVVFNLPSDLKGLPSNFGSPENTSKLGANVVSSRTDFGKPGFGGACPPVGDKSHRYIFTVWALKLDKLPLDENSPAAMVGYYLNQNVLQKSSITAFYGR